MLNKQAIFILLTLIVVNFAESNVKNIRVLNQITSAKEKGNYLKKKFLDQLSLFFFYTDTDP